jgi:lipopolysaccharide biosynthesis regulator YciM
VKEGKSQLHSIVVNHTTHSEPDNEPSFATTQGNAEAMQYLAELNEEAVQLINADSFTEALNALSQAEDKISTLENIEHHEETYIITVFYNIACCHQKLGELQKCNAYLKLTIQLLKKLFAKRNDLPRMTKRRKLVENLMRLRYHTKFHLQI